MLHPAGRALRLGVACCLVLAAGFAAGAEETDGSLAEATRLASALEAYPQHAADVTEFRALAAETEATGERLSPGPDGVLERGMLDLGALASRLSQRRSRLHNLQGSVDQKEIEQKRHEQQEAVFDDAIDSARSSYEQARGQFKKALRILQSNIERQSQIVQKISN